MIVALFFKWMMPTPQPMKPGKCECTHNRSSHENGTGKCVVRTAEYAQCACQIYIADVNGRDPELEQLRKIAGVK